MTSASYFDGRSARLHTVELVTRDNALALAGGAIHKEYTFAEVILAEPFAKAPAVLYFADGARCEVSGADARERLTQALGYRKSRVTRWQDRWYGALLALVLLVAVGLALMIWGVPAAAEKIAASIPPSLDRQLGASALAGLDAHLLEPTRLSAERVAEVEQVMRAILPPGPRLPIRLLIRDAPALGANALALPDGTIVVTDAMVRQIVGKRDQFGPTETAQLGGVLAHEVAHIERRHSVRVMARSSLTAAASAALLGDFSAVAAGIPAVLMNMRYSREMETEADDYAIALLRRQGISPAPLAALFEALDAAQQPDPAHRMPSWMTASMEYLSSHPASAERIRRLRNAARK